MPASPIGPVFVPCTSAVHHAVHLLGHRRDVPLEGVACVEVEDRLEFGIREVDGEVEVDGDERGVPPEIEAGAKTHLEIRVELVAEELVHGDVEVFVLDGLVLQFDLP